MLRKALLFKNGIKGALGILLDNLNQNKRNSFISEMEIGYHAFHTYGLAMLKSIYPEHILWESKVIKESLSYLTSNNYLKKVILVSMALGTIHLELRLRIQLIFFIHASKIQVFLCGRIF